MMSFGCGAMRSADGAETMMSSSNGEAAIWIVANPRPHTNILSIFHPRPAVVASVASVVRH
jgi:hypothetical protein